MVTEQRRGLGCLSTQCNNLAAARHWEPAAAAAVYSKQRCGRGKPSSYQWLHWTGAAATSQAVQCSPSQPLFAQSTQSQLTARQSLKVVITPASLNSTHTGRLFGRSLLVLLKPLSVVGSWEIFTMSDETQFKLFTANSSNNEGRVREQKAVKTSLVSCARLTVYRVLIVVRHSSDPRHFLARPGVDESNWVS